MSYIISFFPCFWYHRNGTLLTNHLFIAVFKACLVLDSAWHDENLCRQLFMMSVDVFTHTLFQVS